MTLTIRTALRGGMRPKISLPISLIVGLLVQSCGSGDKAQSNSDVRARHLEMR